MTHAYVWHDSFIHEWHDSLRAKSSSKCEQIKILKSQLAAKFKMKMLLTFERFDWSTQWHAVTPCNILQSTSTHCNTMQHTATRCNTLQHDATHCNTKMRAAFTRVTWLIHICDMTHSHVCHDSFMCMTCVAWLIHVRDMTASFVWMRSCLQGCVCECVSVCEARVVYNKCCIVLQCVASCCSVLHRVCVSVLVYARHEQGRVVTISVASCCIVLHRVAVCCIVLHRVAVCCIVCVWVC